MTTSKIKDLKKGDYFRLDVKLDGSNSPVWVRGEYVRSEKKYSAYKFDDTNHEHLFAPGKEVVIGFEF